MSELDRPLIFIFNFGKVASSPALEKLTDETETTGVVYECNFHFENTHEKQCEASLNAAFREIMKYAKTGIPLDETGEGW